MERKAETVAASLPLALVVGMAAVLAFSGCVGAKKDTVSTDNVYVHTIEAGESLEDIADQYYGDTSRAEIIASFNSITADELRPGKTLRIPMSDEDVEQRRTREKALGPYNEGLANAEQGSYLDAVNRFNEALAIDPSFADAHYNLGVTLQKLESYEKATEEFDQACRLRPADTRYRFALGNAYFHREQYKDAVKMFGLVLERDPGFAEAQYSLAVCYEKLGETEKAKRAWQRYLELDGKGVWAAEARKHLRNLE